jgi:hypothetical protein
VPDPRSTYDERLTKYRAEGAALRKRERVLSMARIALFVAAVVIAIVHFSGWIAIPIVGFVALVIAHDKVIKTTPPAPAGGRRRRDSASAASSG